MVVVSDPAILQNKKKDKKRSARHQQDMDSGNNLGITVHMSHRLGDDIEVGHIFARRRRVLVLEESEEHWFFGVSDFSCIHVGTHFVYARADELVDSMSTRTREKLGKLALPRP